MDQLWIFPSDEFSPERSSEVLEQTRQYLATSGYGQTMKCLIQAFFPTWKLIPIPNEAILSEHTFPWRESYHDLQIGFTLATFGLYKQAHASLRSAVEQGLLTVYWNIEDDGPKRIRAWLKSRENTPFSRKVWTRIERHRNFALFQESYNIRGEFEALGDLHDYVHTKGVRYSNALPFPEGGKLRVAGQRFSESAFANWESSFERVLRFIALCYLVRYPLGTIRYDWSRKFGIDVPAFGCLETDEVDRLEELVTSIAFRRLLPIAEQDSHVVEAMKWVASIPEMTEAETETQLIEFDKSLVRDMGLDKWLSFERVCIAMAEEQGEDTTAWQARLERVKAWAELRSVESQ
jgi:hypothetical protein